MKEWSGLPWHSLSHWLQTKFGQKVYRVSIDGGFTCPNRDGNLARGGCIYCNAQGARAGYVNPEISPLDQLEQGMRFISRRYGAQKFLAYFQAYSGTYAPVDRLLSLYQPVVDHPDVVGLCIGTRPDCVNPAILDLLARLAEQKLVILEYGVQTVHDTTLQFINRHHNAQDSREAVDATLARPGIMTLAHLIMGLPGETSQDMLETIKTVTGWGVHALKIHHLYIEKNTPLESLYRKGEIRLLNLEEYLDIICSLLPWIPPEVVIHRLFGQCSPGDLVGPDWTLHKHSLLRQLQARLQERGLYQGCSLTVNP